ncbi:hypothetical protein [Lactobacillus sp.]|nr:hypothetical protein [Lactobacillus sp.]MBD5430118.1 hypothetical protein [Lactobacillus sp.]
MSEETTKKLVIASNAIGGEELLEQLSFNFCTKKAPTYGRQRSEKTVN